MLLEKIIQKLKRPPDVYIGGKDNPYLLRWWIIPRNPWFNIYLHNMLRDDDDRALHDHMYWNASIILKNGYIEWVPRMGDVYRPVPISRHPGDIVIRKGKQAHRLALFYRTAPCWSLFITGPRYREWGFWCPKGWRHHSEYLDPKNPELAGKGCDD